MGQTDKTKPLCVECGERNALHKKGTLCRPCYDRLRSQVKEDNALAHLSERIKSAQKTGDWKQLAESLNPVIRSVADGSVKATAAQGSLLKHIMDRAYGRVSKSQEDSQGPLGIVVLPTLGEESTTHVCLKCIEAHKLHG